MSFHSLIAHFFLALNNNPLSECTTVYLSNDLLKDILVDSSWSVAKSCLTLCEAMDCSRPGLPVHHQLLELAQTHVHRAGAAIQPFHPLSSPSPPALNFSQHQGHFQWVSSSHQVTKVLEFQHQHQSFQWIFRTNSFRIDWIDLLAVQRTLESSPIPQFKSINSSVLSFLNGPTLTTIHDYWKSHNFDYMDLCWQSNLSAF